MSRQFSLMVTLSSTVLGVLGWSNPNLVAQPTPNTIKVTNPLPFSSSVDSWSENNTTIKLFQSCSTQNSSDSESSYSPKSEAQKLLQTNDICFAELTPKSSNLLFSSREKKLTTPQIFTPSSIAQDNSSEGNSESNLDQPSSSSPEIESEDENDWQFKLKPFFPIPITTYGSAAIGNRSVDFQLNLGEVLDVLRLAASGRFEAWKGDLGLIVSGYYVSLRGNGIKEFERFPNFTLEKTLKYDQGVYDFALSYRFGDRPEYSPTEQTLNQSFPLVWFEPIIGTRLNDINTTIEQELDFGRLGKTKQPTFEKGRTWFEPLVGGNLGLQVSEPLTLWVRGVASGFGLAGDQADMSWNIVSGVDWRVNRNVSLQLGYYFFLFNYEIGSGNNTLALESNQNGPYLSATFSF